MTTPPDASAAPVPPADDAAAPLLDTPPSQSAAEPAAPLPEPAAEPTEPAEPAEPEAADAAPAPEPPVAPAQPATPAPEQPAGPEAADAAPAPEPPPAEPGEPAAASSDTGQDSAPVAGPTAPKPGPRPSPPPKPGPPARPGPRAAAPAPRPAAAPTHSDEDIVGASAWGRVDPDGTVFVTEGKSERAVGQFPGVGAAEALALYARRFLDLEAQVKLFEARVEQLSKRDIDQTLSNLKQALAEPAAVGDLDGLRARYRAVKAHAAAVRQRIEAERAAAKSQALAERTALVERAEAIAEQHSDQVNWKLASTELREILDVWREAQRSGPKIDRPTEDELWRRFSHARTSFDRKRRAFFAELDKRQGTTKLVKEQIVAEAEKLAGSQDWAATGREFRDLMERWRAAGRLSRREDDALWERFRGAQDQFFRARDAQHAANDAEREANLTAKLAIVEEAEKLVPVRDLRAAKAKLREFEDQWDKIGHVPRRDQDRVEARMKAVEDAIRVEEERAWRKTNPETVARMESMTSQLEAVIAGLERKLVKVEASGDATAIAALKEDLRARQQMLDNLRRSAERSWE
ncbi:MAG: DUF349 domain-containing protein [Bifidobacteriaceae bacterium]|nr:DUF349 domain-containing protein [Bifidobacteriaceae bacterium]